MGRISFIDRAWKKRAAGQNDGGPFLAYLVRQSRTLKDALRRWVAERPPVPESLRGTKPAVLEMSASMFRAAQKELASRPDLLAGLPDDVKVSDLFPPNAGEFLARPDGLEALAASCPEGSPGRRVLEGLLARGKAAALVDGFGFVAVTLGMEAGRPLRAELADRIVLALGEPPDYAAAWKVLESWRAEKVARKRPDGMEESDRPTPIPPELDFVLREAVVTVAPLVRAFEDPWRFFRDVVPALFPGELDRPIPDLLATWGIGVLLNPETNAKFLEAGRAPGFSALLAEVEGRPAFEGDGGRPLNSEWSAFAATYFAPGQRRGAKGAFLRDLRERFPNMSEPDLRKRLKRHRGE